MTAISDDDAVQVYLSIYICVCIYVCMYVCVCVCVCLCVYFRFGYRVKYFFVSSFLAYLNLAKYEHRHTCMI
jgi:hypothetical protein